MAEAKQSINWNSVVTNAVSTLVAAVFVGAAFIVWNAATTIDTRIETATTKIKQTQGTLHSTQQDLQAAQKTMTDEIANLHAELRLLKTLIANQDDLELLIEPAAGPLPVPPPSIQPPSPAATALEMKQLDVERIQNEYQKNRFEIQQQVAP